MVARRIELRSTRSNLLNEAKESQDTPLQAFKREKPHFGNSFIWIVMIFVGLIVFHCYDAYHQQIKAEETEQKEGMDCLYQFKTEECNPMKLSEKCSELLQCVQRSAKDVNQMEVLAQMIKRTSKSLSQTIFGPVTLVFGALLVGYLKEKI